MKVFAILVFLFISVGAVEFIYTEGYQDTIDRVKQDPNHLASLMIITSATSCDKCKQAIKVYEDFMYEVDNVVKAYVLDCRKIEDNDRELQIIPACYEANSDMLPALTFLAPPEQTSTYETTQSRQPVEKQFTGTLTLSALLDAVDDHAPYFASRLEDLDYLDTIWLKDTTFPTKVLLLRPDDRVPLYWKGLTSFYRFKLDFADIDADDKVLKKRYKVSGDQQDIVILQYDDKTKSYNQTLYKGGKRYDVLKDYLKSFALKRKLTKKNQKTLYEEDPQNWGKVEQFKFRYLKNILEQNEQWIMVHFTINNQVHPQFSSFKQDFKGLTRFYQIDCSEEDCQQKMKIKSPALLIYPFNKKSINTPIIVKNKDTFEFIAELMLDNIKAQTLTFKNSEDQFALSECKQILDQGFYPVLWYYKENDAYWNLVGATLSSLAKYQKLMRFVFSKNPSKNTRKQFGIKSLPMIQSFVDMNLNTGQHRKYDFQGQLSIENLISYFNQVATEKEKTVQIQKDAEPANNQDDFDQKCATTDKLCVIAFLDTVKEGRFNQDREILKKAVTIYEDVVWLWIDGRCQEKLMKKLNIEKFPSLIVYNPAREKIFKFEEEKFTSREISKFVEFARKNKKKFKLLTELFEIEDINCDVVRQNLKNEYQEEKRRRHQLFIQAEREKDKEYERLRRIQEQKELLEDYDSDDSDDKDDHDEDL